LWEILPCIWNCDNVDNWAQMLLMWNMYDKIASVFLNPFRKTQDTFSKSFFNELREIKKQIKFLFVKFPRFFERYRLWPLIYVWIVNKVRPILVQKPAKKSYACKNLLFGSSIKFDCLNELFFADMRENYDDDVKNATRIGSVIK